MAYKIVVEYNSEYGIYESLMVRGAAAVTYAVGKRTVSKPNCGPLTAFKSIHDVISFKLTHGFTRFPVFKCRVRKYRGKRRALWDNMDNMSVMTNLPKGTILCSSITLTRRIK